MDTLSCAATRSIGLANLGELMAALDAPDEALELFDEAIDIAREVQDKHTEADALWQSSKVLYELNLYAIALSRAEEALLLHQAIGLPEATVIVETLARWQQEQGESS